MHIADQIILKKLEKFSNIIALEVLDKPQIINLTEPSLSQSINFLEENKERTYDNFLISRKNKYLFYNKGKITELNTTNRIKSEDYEMPESESMLHYKEKLQELLTEIMRQIQCLHLRYMALKCYNQHCFIPNLDPTEYYKNEKST